MIQHAIYQPLCFHFGLIMLANDAIAPIRRPTRSQKAPASASKCFKSFTSQKGGMTMLSKNFHTLFWGKCHHFLFSAPEMLWMLWGAKWAASPGFLEAGRSCWFKLKWKMSFLSWFLRPSHEALEPATGKNHIKASLMPSVSVVSECQMDCAYWIGVYAIRLQVNHQTLGIPTCRCKFPGWFFFSLVVSFVSLNPNGICVWRTLKISLNLSCWKHQTYEG